MGNRIDGLREKIKRALVKPNIPTMEQRRVLFCRMVKINDEVEEILSVAADTTSSIDDTITMVLNNCI